MKTLCGGCLALVVAGVACGPIARHAESASMDKGLRSFLIRAIAKTPPDSLAVLKKESLRAIKNLTRHVYDYKSLWREMSDLGDAVSSTKKVFHNWVREDVKGTRLPDNTEHLKELKEKILTMHDNWVAEVEEGLEVSLQHLEKEGLYKPNQPDLDMGAVYPAETIYPSSFLGKKEIIYTDKKMGDVVETAESIKALLKQPLELAPPQ